MLNSISPDSDYIHKPNKFLKSIAPESSGGLALDICIGGGRDALYLSSIGYDVTAIDVLPEFAEKCNMISKENDFNVKAYSKPLNEIIIPENSYDLITSSWVLHTLKKSESYNLIHNMIKGLKHGGYLILALFSVNDPFFKNRISGVNLIEENTFYSEDHKKYIHYFSKEELILLTKELRLITIADKLNLDTGHDHLHYHGVIELAAMKLPPVNFI